MILMLHKMCRGAMKPQGAYTVYYYCDIRPSDETTIRKHIEKW